MRKHRPATKNLFWFFASPSANPGLAQFAPGTDPSKFPKALHSGADMVCLELEDGVAPHEKDSARENMLTIFAVPQADDGIERTVRINALNTAEGRADIEGILQAPGQPQALMLPKVNAPDEVSAVSDMLGELGLTVRLQVIIETCRGLELAHEIARASGRVDALVFGGFNLAADLRCAYGWEPLLYARSKVVHAAASAGIDVIDAPWLDLGDHDGLRAEAEAAARLGFTGKSAIHPSQIEIINTIFTPSADEIAYARKVVAAFEEARTGLVVVGGKMIDRPVLRAVARTLAAAERAGL